MLRSTENCQNWSLVHMVQTPLCYSAAVKPGFNVKVAPEGEQRRKTRKKEEDEDEGEWRRKKGEEGGRQGKCGYGE